MRTSDALDLESGVFTKKSSAAIARSLKRSAERSRRRKSAPFRSAMSMLNFHINRGGKGLSASQRKVLERAKDELRRLYSRAPARKSHGKKAGKRTRKKVHFMPKGYHAVTPYLACRDAARAIEFYKEAFDAKELMRMPAPGGKIGHAEVRIGDSRVMLTDEYPDMDFLSPQSRGGTTVHLHVYVRDVDAMCSRAVQAGAKLIREVKDQFYGDRTGSLQDPFGHVWHLATHKEDLSMAELKKRGAKAMKGAGGG